MRDKELQELVKASYTNVAIKGRDTARIYHAVVKLDGLLLDARREVMKRDAEIQRLKRHLAALPADLRNQYNPDPDR